MSIPTPVVQRWLVAWLGAIVVGVANGVARRVLYEDRIGSSRKRPCSAVAEGWGLGCARGPAPASCCTPLLALPADPEGQAEALRQFVGIKRDLLGFLQAKLDQDARLLS